MPNFPTQTGKDTNLVELAMIGLRKWPILCLGAALGGGIGYVASRFMPLKFSVSSLVQIDTQARRPSGSLGEMADLFQTDARAETETELLQSKAVAGSVVDSMGLVNVASSNDLVRRFRQKTGRMDIASLKIPLGGPKSKPWTAVALDNQQIALRDTNKVVVLEAKLGEWTQKVVGTDTVGIRFDSLSAEVGEVFTIRKYSRAVVVSGILGALKVTERGRRTGVLELRFKWYQPDMAQKILNAIAATYVRQNIETRSAEARKSLEFLQQQMPKVRSRLDSLEDILKNYRFQKGSIDIGSEARAALQGQTDLQQQVLNLQQRKQEMLRLYKEDHPTIAAIDAQILQVQNALSGSSRQVKNLPLTQQAIAKLSRDVDVETALYSALLNSIQQMQVIRGGEVGNARIVDQAEFPFVPDGPARKMVILAFLIGGLVVSFVAVVAVRVLDNGVIDSESLERATGLPILAQIPISPIEYKGFKKSKGNHLLSVVESNDLAVEALRSLRTGLELSLGTGPRIVTVTGMSVDDGKSFVSSNLAVLFAQMGKRVVLVDADLRRGRLAALFGKSGLPGLAEFLKGEREVSAILHSTAIPGLGLVPAGTHPGNPSELLGSEAFGKFLKSLAQNCDLVLVDTPPIMVVSDPLFAMRTSIQSLVVVAAGIHTARDIQEGVRRIGLAGISNLGFVLNKCDWASKGFGYYLKYGKYGQK